nr:MAG TPA: hypothetical protein [Bacteriophage sp.]
MQFKQISGNKKAPGFPDTFHLFPVCHFCIPSRCIFVQYASCVLYLVGVQ